MPIWTPEDAAALRAEANRHHAELAGLTEYAIQLGDGTMATGWDDYVGHFVQTWTSEEDAQREVDRIKVCGLQLRPGGGIDRDPVCCGAKLVRRQVTSWVAA